MKKIISEIDIREANNMERCELLISIIKRTSNIYTRHRYTQRMKRVWII